MAEQVDYELTDAERSLLDAATSEATARAGARGGSIGGAIGGGLGGGLAGAAGGSMGGGRGGARGSRFGARFLKPRTALAALDTSLDASAALERARTLIDEQGVEVEDPNAGGDGSVWGLLTSGAMGMAPALVRVGARPATGGAHVEIRATGKEGLVRQKIGAKAADAVAAAIRSA